MRRLLSILCGAGWRGRAAAAGFARDRRGGITVEAVIILPIVIWAYVASFVFYDGFRVQNTNIKAAYVVSDLLARSTEPVTPAYLEGVTDLYEMLAQARHPVAMRVASIDWDIVNQRHRLRWSYGTRSLQPFTEADLTGRLAGRITDLSTGESALIIETVLDYTPLLEVGVRAQRMENLIQMRPRFMARVQFLENGELRG